jgi:hypothetical protein
MSELIDPSRFTIGEEQHVNAGVPDHFVSDCVSGCAFWEKADLPALVITQPVDREHNLLGTYRVRHSITQEERIVTLDMPEYRLIESLTLDLFGG